MPYLPKYLAKDKLENLNRAAIAYLASLDYLQSVFPAVAQSIVQELKTQRSHLKLIASENYSSLAVQLAMGNLLTDKYAEGYPHHRFYAGCENVDTIEETAANLLIKIFDAEHAYVQPHSGADANLVAFWSVLVHKIQNREVEKLGKKTADELTPDEYEKIRKLMMSQKILGQSLNSGGHLTHGYRHNVSAKMMQALSYDVDRETGLLDYQIIAEKAKAEKPLILLAGYSAYSRKINFAIMREIAESIGAVLVVDMAHFAGLVAGKVFVGEFDPVPHAHIITSTTHKTLRGPRGGFVLCRKEFSEIINKGCPLVLGGPLPHVMAAKAVAFQEADTPDFHAYAQRVVDNARALAERLMAQGMKILTKGTDNHLVLWDISSFGLTGRQAEIALKEAGMTVNRNAIPFDSNGPWYTSGVRLGTAALTTLGMGPDEMHQIADTLVDVLKNTQPAIVQKTNSPSKTQTITEENARMRAEKRIREILARFPLYPEIEIS